MGCVPFEEALALQARLVYEATDRDDGQVWVLLCEHPPLVTVGRRGSYAHVYLDPEELRARQLELRYVQHGGPALVHGPGQLAVYAIVPLWWYGMSVGEHLRRLEGALAQALDALGVPVQTRPGHFGLWARTGQVAHLAVAVRDWTTYFGAYIHVSPNPALQKRVLSDPEYRTSTSSLLANRRHGIKMTRVRQTLVEHLAAAWPCRRHHIYTHPPILPGGDRRESA